ncbi:MAG: hypothetical protein DMF56_24660 [Acidobacteria bacterium]|nr:MAG: hypothetical protein DMF56_24660 [Acidobacteriota bacterium]
MPVLKRWLPVVAWSAVILMTSNDQFSAAHTGGWLRELFPTLPEPINISFRKLMHLTGYGILGALAFRAAHAGMDNVATAALSGRGAAEGSGTHKAFKLAVPVAFAVVLVVACTDEWHQSLYASRGASPWDVLLDVVGAAIAIGIMIRVKQYRPRRNTE